jgi:CRP/FNR family transcriptional regulator, cyclic AMP receptor protein
MYIGTYFRNLDHYNRISLPKSFAPQRGRTHYSVRVVKDNNILEFFGDVDDITNSNRMFDLDTIYHVGYKYPRIVLKKDLLAMAGIHKNVPVAIIGMGKSFYLCPEEIYRERPHIFVTVNHMEHNTTAEVEAASGVSPTNAVDVSKEETQEPISHTIRSGDTSREHDPITNKDDNGERRRILEKHVLLGKLSVEEIDTLLAYARREQYSAGREIFAKGSPGQSMMAVLHGTVKISSLSSAGKEIIFIIINQGEIFGEIAMLDGGERSADAIAMTDCELLVINRRDFMRILERHADICIILIQILCRRMRQTSEQVEDVIFRHLESRIAKALLQLAQNTGEQGRGRSVDLHISQRELGNIAAGTRESVNKQLQTWQRAGVIDLRKGAIVIRDIAALERLSLLDHLR